MMPTASRILIAESGSGFGGTSRYLQGLVGLLDRQRFTVRIVAASCSPMIERIQKLGVRVEVKPFWRFPWLAAPSGGPRIFRYVQYAAVGTLQMITQVPLIAIWLKRRHIQLVHLNNDILSHLPLLLGARLAGCRLLCHLHGWRPMTLIERWASRFVDEWVAVSQAGARYFQSQLGGRPVTGIPNGLALNGHGGSAGEDHSRQGIRKRLGLASADVAVMLIGRLVPLKGQEVYLKALAQALKRHPRFVGMLVGRDPSPGQRYLTQLKALAKTLGIASRVLFIPWQEDVWPLYEAADLVVHASTQPEPFGLVILEAMAARRPVIATGAGGVLDLVKDGQTGLLVSPGSVEELSGAIARLAQDQALAAALTRNAYAQVTTSFRMEDNASKIMTVYDRLLMKGRLPC